MDHGEGSYRRFLAGDVGAFDAIWKEYRDPLTFFIDRIVHDSAAAEDLSIDVFTYLLTHPRKYNFKTSLKTYLFMLGRSRALDHLRHGKVLTFVELDQAHGTEDCVSVEDAVVRDEVRRAVHAALGELPQDQRIAVHLVYLEGFSYEDAARVMKKSRKQMDNLLYRAKGALRAVLGKEGGLF